MKILKKLKYTLVYMFIIPFLIKDKHLNETSKNIFSLYILENEPENIDWRYRKLVSYCLYKGLPGMILAAFNGDCLSIKTEIDFNKLKAAFGYDFKTYYFNNISESWLKQKWYSDNSLPIICQIKNNLIVLDGNHRLSQQIHFNEIKYNFITVNGGWLNLFFKIIFNKI